MKEYYNIGELIVSTTLGFAFGTVIGVGIEHNRYKRIPKTDEVQAGYVVPSMLEINLQDLDGNGEKEVLFKYDGKNYLLMLDEQGAPRIQAYAISPLEPDEIAPEAQ